MRAMDLGKQRALEESKRRRKAERAAEEIKCLR